MPATRGSIPERVYSSLPLILARSPAQPNKVLRNNLIGHPGPVPYAYSVCWVNHYKVREEIRFVKSLCIEFASSLRKHQPELRAAPWSRLHFDLTVVELDDAEHHRQAD